MKIENQIKKSIKKMLVFYYRLRYLYFKNNCSDYLDYNLISQLTQQFPDVPPYGYDIKSCANRGRQRAKFLHDIFKPSDSGSSILELGCMDAMTSFALKDLNYKAYALDVVDQKAEIVKKSDVKFINSTAEKIALPDNSMDYVFSYNAFEHFKKPGAVVEQVARVLKQGGRFYADFDPLYYSPRGLHAYRKINIPYCQILFKIEDLKKYAHENNLHWENLPYVNRYSLEQYDDLLRNMEEDFRVLKYEKGMDVSSIKIIDRYKNCFKKYPIDFDNFIISRIQILAEKL